MSGDDARLVLYTAWHLANAARTALQVMLARGGVLTVVIGCGLGASVFLFALPGADASDATGWRTHADIRPDEAAVTAPRRTTAR